MELKQILEAIVFSAQKPMSIGELRTLLRETPEKLPDEPQTGEYAKATARAVEKALEELAVEHDAADRSYRLACVGGNWQFVTKPDFAPWLQVLVGAKPRPPKLSNPALETLAIIAYHQPITRAEMEDIRGVETSKGTIDVLMETGWVKMRGRRKTPGRPVTYGTTAEFLDHFGLSEIRDLPGMEELKGAGLLSSRMPAGFSMPLPSVDPDELTEEEEELTDIDLEELGLLTPKGGDD